MKKALCQPGFHFVDEISQGFNRDRHCHGFSVPGHTTQNSYDLLGLAVNDKPTTRTRANSIAVRGAVVKSQEATRRFALKRPTKLQEAADGTDGFLRISIDVHFLPELKVIETEGNAVIMRQRVAQLVDGDVPARIVFHGIGQGAAVDCGSIIVGSGSQVAVNDLVAF